MNKVELVKSVMDKAIEDTVLKKDDVEKIINIFLDAIRDELANGGKIQITNFGTFETVDYGARECKNPKTQEVISIPSRKAPRFKPSKAFKDYVNE